MAKILTVEVYDKNPNEYQDLSWLEDFKQSKFAIHCKTEKEAEILYKILQENNIDWEGNWTGANWDAFGDKTCYRVWNEGNLLSLVYDSIDYYLKRGETTVDFTELNLDDTIQNSQTKQVTWQEALEARSNGYTIECKLDQGTKIYPADMLEMTIHEREIRKGIWSIVLK